MKSLKRLMKKESDVKQICKSEVEKYLNDSYAQIFNDGAYSAIATTFYILHRDFGFGTARLRKLKERIEEENKLMNVGILGRKYDANDLIKFLQDKLNVDIMTSSFEEESK